MNKSIEYEKIPTMIKCVEIIILYVIYFLLLPHTFVELGENPACFERSRFEFWLRYYFRNNSSSNRRLNLICKIIIIISIWLYYKSESNQRAVIYIYEVSKKDSKNKLHIELLFQYLILIVVTTFSYLINTIIALYFCWKCCAFLCTTLFPAM